MALEYCNRCTGSEPGERLRRLTAGVGSLNHAAIAQKYAFMTKEMTTSRRKKMLFRKRELMNQEETAGRHSQELASA